MSSLLSIDLKEPLIETAVPFDADVEQARLAQGTATTPSDSDDDDSSSSMTWLDCIIIWTVLPFLLWLDFSMALFIQANEEHGADAGASTDTSLTSPNVRMVQLSILLFILASYMYRKTIHEMRLSHALLVLMPEIMMDGVLLLILFGQLLMAFRALLCSILGLCLVVMVYNVWVLCFLKRDDEKEQLRLRVKTEKQWDTSSNEDV